MNVVTQSWVIITLTIGCEKITNSRQHSEPIEFEEMKRRTFAFCLRTVGFGVDVGKRGTWVSFFHFLKFVMNFLTVVVSMCHSFRSTDQPGRINGFEAFKLSIYAPVLAKTQVLNFYQPHMAKQKPFKGIIEPRFWDYWAPFGDYKARWGNK